VRGARALHRWFHKLVPTIILTLAATAYKAAQELGLWPNDILLFPFLVLAAWILFLYWALAGALAVRCYNQVYKKWAKERRSMAYGLAFLIGATIGGGTGAGWWKLFEMQRKQMAKLGVQMSSAVGSPVVATPPPLKGTEIPPTLADLFKKDFSHTMKATDELQLKRHMDGVTVHVKRQVYLDFDAKTELVGFYVPSQGQFSDETFKICTILLGTVQPAIEDLMKRIEVRSSYKDEGTTIKDLRFSGRVFLYHEDFLSITQKAELINRYKAQNYDLQFRGLDYLADQVIAWHAQHDSKESH
jgi:hypothetical protein